jgi:CubicO group peptidase (beta-lactamase class C family)
MIHGDVAPGFEPVLAAFERNFTVGGEVGASVAVVLDGQLVVDLWGGWADRLSEKPWKRDSLQLVFCGTKGSSPCAC